VNLRINPKKIALIWAFFAVSFALTSFALQFCKLVLGFRPPLLPVLQELLNVRHESSIATWYSSSSLLLCAILTLAIAFSREPDREQHYGDRNALLWAPLSLVFLYLSADEAVEIHETVGMAVGRAVLHTIGLYSGDLFHRQWVIYAAFLAVLVGLVSLKLIKSLPVRTRRLLLGAGALYVTGAIGMELIWALYEDLYGRDNAPLILIGMTTIEELLEMLGVVVVIYALTSYLASRAEETRISFV
jgi:hypothetical protein